MNYQLLCNGYEQLPALCLALMNHDLFSIIIPICVLPDDPNFDIPRCFNSSKGIPSRFQAWENGSRIWEKDGLPGNSAGDHFMNAEI